MTRFIRIASVFVLALSLAGTASAEYPEREIQLIVPTSAGGGSDRTARVYAKFVKEYLGKPVVVVNRPGGGGAIGITAVLNAKPDGYTMGQLMLPEVVSRQFDNPTAKFGADSFEYIGKSGIDNHIFAVRNDSKLQTYQDMVAFAKANPGKLSCGVTGVGGGPQLASLRWQKLAGVKLNLVSFKGGAQIRGALLGGHIDILCANTGAVSKVLKKVRILALSADKPHPKYPNVPTLKSLGINLFVGTERILAMPKGTPAKILAKLRAAHQKTLANPKYRKAAKKAKVTIDKASPETVAQKLKSEENDYRALWADSPWVKDR
jgi:tripartite-type tricarboxylate transporter receptor subunit TctC